MKKIKVPQSLPYVGNEEYESIKSCFENNWITEGPKAKQFIDEVCQMVDAKYGVLAPNGTLALFLGLLALDIKVEDEVIVPNFTFIASATSVCLAKAVPVFVDIKENLQIDIDDCERVLTKKTKAIMPCHMFGMASNMDEVLDFAKKNNLKVIEDACQGLGVKWCNRNVGSFGDVGCFSFFADKSIVTAEGGAVVTNNKNIFNKLSLLRNQGRFHRGTFIHPEIGFNFRMNDILCSIGLTQLNKSKYIFDRKKEIYELYVEEMKDVKEIKILKPSNKKTNIIPFRVVAFTKTRQQDVCDYMKDEGIEIRTLFYPLNRQPCFKHLKDKYEMSDEFFPNSINAFEYGMCLPSYPQLKNEDIKYICDVLKRYYNV